METTDRGKKHHRIMEEKHEELLGELLNELPADQVRAVKIINEGSLSAWLTALPIAAENFDLSEVEFRDALSVRYNKNLITSPTFCDGCQSPFTLRHALACKKGGLLTLRHNEIRDAVGDLASLVWKDVQREPVIRENNPQDETPPLISDLFCRGVYDRQGAASFDIGVSDTDAISYQNRSPMSVLHSAEVEKRTKNIDACQERHMFFTPLVVSVDGMLAPEFASILRRIRKALSTKWEKPYSKIMNWVKISELWLVAYYDYKLLVFSAPRSLVKAEHGIDSHFHHHF